MNDRIIVNCGIGRHYDEQKAAMRAACRKHCKDTDFLFYDDLPAGCPPQDVMQYAFKIYALQEAIERRYRFVLWMDCAFRPIGDIAPLWDSIAQHGWFVAPQLDENLATWCSDDALKFFGIARDAAARIPLVYSGLVGLDMQSGAGNQIWHRWRKTYEAGVFNGPHKNLPGEPMRPWGHKFEGHCSHDASVAGHRHDESALSFVLALGGLRPEARGMISPTSPSGCVGLNV